MRLVDVPDRLSVRLRRGASLDPVEWEGIAR